jgi:hypothetical protein
MDHAEAPLNVGLDAEDVNDCFPSVLWKNTRSRSQNLCVRDWRRRLSLPDRLIQRVEHKLGLHRCRGPPCCDPKAICVQITQGNDPTREDVDHEGQIE